MIGVGVKNSTSDLLISNCDEFIYYDDLVRDVPASRKETNPRGAMPAAKDAEAAEGPEAGSDRSRLGDDEGAGGGAGRHEPSSGAR